MHLNFGVSEQVTLMKLHFQWLAVVVLNWFIAGSSTFKNIPKVQRQCGDVFKNDMDIVGARLSCYKSVKRMWLMCIVATIIHRQYKSNDDHIQVWIGWCNSNNICETIDDHHNDDEPSIVNLVIDRFKSAIYISIRSIVSRSSHKNYQLIFFNHLFVKISENSKNINT